MGRLRSQNECMQRTHVNFPEKKKLWSIATFSYETNQLAQHFFSKKYD